MKIIWPAAVSIDLLLVVALTLPAVYSFELRRKISSVHKAKISEDMSTNPPQMIVATRIHLGKATVPPTQANLDATVLNFYRFCTDSCAAGDVIAVLAVDAEERVQGYNLLEAVQVACDKAAQTSSIPLHVLPVQPWGMFVPALNALVSWASPLADQILFVSAETTASAKAIEALRFRMTDDTLVCGALLPGHDYKGEETQQNEGIRTELNGRTTPWNTLALWDLKKLALTGFQSVSDGLHGSGSGQQASIAGVEEVVAIAVLQKLLGPEHTKAKLVRTEGVEWDQRFDDPARQLWHEHKMKSKMERAAKQLELTGLQGIVHHC
jgi:hypothetical protein